MIKLPIIAVKNSVYKAGTSEESKYQVLTIMLEDGDSAKVNNYTAKEAKAGQYAVLSLQVDRKTGTLMARLKDVA